jgi:hypothetical protein
MQELDEQGDECVKDEEQRYDCDDDHDDGLIWKIVCCDECISRAFFYILHTIILGSVPFCF